MLAAVSGFLGRERSDTLADEEIALDVLTVLVLTGFDWPYATIAMAMLVVVVLLEFFRLSPYYTKQMLVHYVSSMDLITCLICCALHRMLSSACRSANSFALLTSSL